MRTVKFQIKGPQDAQKMKDGGYNMNFEYLIGVLEDRVIGRGDGWVRSLQPHQVANLGHIVYGRAKKILREEEGNYRRMEQAALSLEQPLEPVTRPTPGPGQQMPLF